MKNIFLIFISTSVVFFGGCGKTLEGLDAIPNKEERNSLLWKIEKDGEISYLLLKRSSKQLYPNVWQCVTGKIENN